MTYPSRAELRISAEKTLEWLAQHSPGPIGHHIKALAQAALRRAVPQPELLAIEPQSETVHSCSFDRYGVADAEFPL